ncbi:MAG: homocysteine S-methyltransferase family protein [Henriciella sp.]|uniref:homocysteine S-methyltransferase family protein n=1 Tax=Henriciella sp. TaxID=1968823 RepID=UPI003C71A210
MLNRDNLALPHRSGEIFLTDGGLETNMIFNRGHPLPEFASHTLFASQEGSLELERYFRAYLELADRVQAGFIIDTATWRAQSGFAGALRVEAEELEEANRTAASFAIMMRDTYGSKRAPVLVNGVIGPWGDGYQAPKLLTADEAEDYHAEQVRWLASAGVDMLTAVTFTNAPEAIGVVRAAQRAGVPVAVSFTVETDGRLPNGQTLKDAIDMVDAATGAAPIYFMVNCAHPSHFVDVLAEGEWLSRIRGFRCNASCKSHAELDDSEDLDCGNPVELAEAYRGLLARVPHANVFGGCCGSDIRHLEAIADCIMDETAKAAAE